MSSRTPLSWAAQARTTTTLMNLAAVMERADESVLPAVYLFVGRSLDATLAEVGGVALCRAVVQALSSPLAGALGDRVPRPSVVCVGAAVWGAATAALAVASSLPAARLSAAVSGLGLALVVPCVQSTVADCHPPEERGRAFGTTSLVSSLGAMAWAYAATSIGGRSVAGVEGWRAVFWAVATVSLLVGVCVRVFGTEPRRMRGADLPPWAPALEHRVGDDACDDDGDFDECVDDARPGAGPGDGVDGPARDEPLADRTRPGRARRGKGAAAAGSSSAVSVEEGYGSGKGRGQPMLLGGGAARDASAPAAAGADAPPPSHLARPPPSPSPVSASAGGLFRVPSNNMLGIISSIKRNSGRSSPAARGLHARSGAAAGAKGVAFAGGGDPWGGGRAPARPGSASGSRGVGAGKEVPPQAPGAGAGLPAAGSASSARLADGLHRASSDARGHRRLGSHARHRFSRYASVPREWSLASLWRDVLRVSSVRSFQVLIAQGIVGSVPWQAMGTCTLWLQTLGFSDARAAGITATFAVGCALGSCLGGWLGDRASRASPGHGRVYVAQTSVLAGLPMSVFVLRILPRMFFDAAAGARVGAAGAVGRALRAAGRGGGAVGRALRVVGTSGGAVGRALRAAPPTRRLLALVGGGALAAAGISAGGAPGATDAAAMGSGPALATRIATPAAVPRSSGEGRTVAARAAPPLGGGLADAARFAATEFAPSQRKALEALAGAQDGGAIGASPAAEGGVGEGLGEGSELSAMVGNATNVVRGRGAAESGALAEAAGSVGAGAETGGRAAGSVGGVTGGGAAGNVTRGGTFVSTSANATEVTASKTQAAAVHPGEVPTGAAGTPAAPRNAAGAGNATLPMSHPRARVLPDSDAQAAGATAVPVGTLTPGAAVAHAVPAPSRSAAAWFRASFFVFGLLISWCGVNNGALMAELVPAELRSSIFALDRGLEGSVGALGAPVVGLIAERFFGSSGRLGGRRESHQAATSEVARREATQAAVASREATRKLMEEIGAADVLTTAHATVAVSTVPANTTAALAHAASSQALPSIDAASSQALPSIDAASSQALPSIDAASSVVSALSIGDANAIARGVGAADASTGGRSDAALGAAGSIGSLAVDDVALPAAPNAAALVPVSGRPPLPPEAAAIGDALLATLLVPWVLCFLAYCFEHWTFPRDRIRANKRLTSMVDLQILGEGSSASRGWSAPASGTGGRRRG